LSPLGFDVNANEVNVVERQLLTYNQKSVRTVFVMGFIPLNAVKVEKMLTVFRPFKLSSKIKKLNVDPSNMMQL
jgi:hypothetical protein